MSDTGNVTAEPQGTVWLKLLLYTSVQKDIDHEMETWYTCFAGALSTFDVYASKDVFLYKRYYK